LIAVFVDLRAAFDSVDRGILKALRERGIREGSVKRMAEVLRETKSRVKVRGKMGKGWREGSETGMPRCYLICCWRTWRRR